jgi:hypothetical protein
VHCDRGVSGAQGAGGRGAATGEPPQMGTSGSQRRGFRRTRAGAGGVPAVGGRAGVFWCPKWPFPLSRLFGGGLESHINPLKSVGTASGWCGVGHRHVPAKCARGYPRKRPGSTPNPKSGSEIAIDTRSGALIMPRKTWSGPVLPPPKLPGVATKSCLAEGQRGRHRHFGYLLSDISKISDHLLV